MAKNDYEENGKQKLAIDDCVKNGSQRFIEDGC